MLAIGLALKAAWSAVSAGLSAAAEWFAALPRGVKIGIIAALALGLWTWAVNDRAYNRGVAYQASEDKAALDLCQANVGTLQGAVEAQNEAVEAFRKESAQRAADAAKAAHMALEAGRKSRAREAERGAGPDEMNAFMRATFQ